MARPWRHPCGKLNHCRAVACTGARQARRDGGWTGDPRQFYFYTKEDPMADLPQPNTLAIDFTLPDGDAQLVRLSDYRGKNVVLAFYPADWSPVCTSELALIQETIDEIRGYNAEVLGISVDNHWSHKAWTDRQHLTFPLLSDFWPHGEVSQRY